MCTCLPEHCIYVLSKYFFLPLSHVNKILLWLDYLEETNICVFYLMLMFINPIFPSILLLILSSIYHLSINYLFFFILVTSVTVILSSPFLTLIPLTYMIFFSIVYIFISGLSFMSLIYYQACLYSSLFCFFYVYF